MNINHNRLVPGAVTYWGDIVGDISDQKDLMEYLSSHGGGGSATAEAVWGSISGNLEDQADLMSKFGEYATQSWVSGQEYLSATALDGYATQEWVSEQGYMTAETLPSDIATQEWVASQGYATESYVDQAINDAIFGSDVPMPDLSSYATMSWVEEQGFATESFVTEQGYVVEDPDNTFVTQSDLTDIGYDPEDPFATEGWVGEQGFYIEDGEDPVATQGYVDQAINDAIFGSDVPMPDLSSYATMSWVEEQGYAVEDGEDPFATQSWVGEQGYLTDVPSDYATQSWVNTNFMRFDSTTYPNLTVVNSSNTEPLVFGYVSFQRGDDIMMATTEMNYDVDYDGPIFGQHWYSLVDGSWVENRSFRRYAMKYEIENDVYEYLNDHSYATQSWVSSQGYLTAETIPSDIATESYVQSALSGFATQSWVQSQNYINSSALSSALSGYATESYVDQAIADAAFGPDGPDLQNILQYDPDDRLKDELDIDVIKRELDNGDEGNTAPYVLGQFVHSNGITTIQVDGSDLFRVNYEEDQETGDLVETTREYIPYTDDEWNVVWTWYNPDLNDDDPVKQGGYVDPIDDGYPFLIGHEDDGHFEGFGVGDMDDTGLKIGRYTRDVNEWDNEGETMYDYTENIDPFLAYHVDGNDEVVQNIGQGYFNIDDTGGTFLMGRHIDEGEYFDGVMMTSEGTLGQYRYIGEWIEGEEEGDGYYEYESMFVPFLTEDVAGEMFLSTDALSGYATQIWVSSNFLTASALSSALSGYATQSWVTSQSYLTASALSSALSDCISLTTDPITSLTYVDVTSQGLSILASMSNNYGYIGATVDSSGYLCRVQYSADGTEIMHDRFATQAWVSNNVGTIVSSALSSYNYVSDGYVDANYVALASIFTGTMSEWLMLDPQDRSEYLIALIKE